MILAGDIGGTKTVLALYDTSGDRQELVRDATFPSREHGSLEEILARFLGAEPTPKIRAGCFGVAGAVIDGECRTTNLPWFLSEPALAQAIGAPRAKLLNDLEAAAFGMLYLRPEDLRVLNPGAAQVRKGHVVVIAAGTGLGEALLFWDGERYHPMASEGGHSDFAPQSDQEIDLLRYLRARFGGHVSYERVLSGPGLHNIYSFLRETSPDPEPSWLAERLQAGDPSAAIAEAGQVGSDPVCVATLDLFASIYGAEAGNLALKALAVGGVFVGGGIAPKLLQTLEQGAFLRSFVDKGRFAGLLNEIPVRVALDPRAPLLGAANYALRL